MWFIGLYPIDRWLAVFFTEGGALPSGLESGLASFSHHISKWSHISRANQYQITLMGMFVKGWSFRGRPLQPIQTLLTGRLHVPTGGLSQVQICSIPYAVPVIRSPLQCSASRSTRGEAYGSQTPVKGIALQLLLTSGLLSKADLHRSIRRDGHGRSTIGQPSHPRTTLRSACTLKFKWLILMCRSAPYHPPCPSRGAYCRAAPPGRPEGSPRGRRTV